MIENKKLLIGAGVTLGLLYLSTRASAAQKLEDEAEGAATEVAPQNIVGLLIETHYQVIHIDNTAFNGIFASSGLIDGEPTAFDWAKVEQGLGRTVFVSRDIKTAIEYGAVILSLTQDAADVFLKDAKSFYKLPVLK